MLYCYYFWCWFSIISIIFFFYTFIFQGLNDKKNLELKFYRITMLQLLSYSEIFGYNLVLWLWCLMLPFKIYCAHKLFCLSWFYRYCFYSYGSVRQCHTVYCRRTVPQGEELSPSTGCFRSFLSFYWSKSEFSVGDVPSFAVFWSNFCSIRYIL